VWASEDTGAVSVPVGRYFTHLLGQLGYDADLRIVDGPTWGAAVYGSPRRAQITFASWTTDYPAASGFIVPAFACDAPSNVDGFCDPAIDRRMDEATRLRATDPLEAGDLWSSIEHDLMDQAAWVPLGTRDWVNLVSERLGNYQSTPSAGPLIDQMWVR
jgi:peptide/nickel transport system substrate-binding protein